MTDFTLEIERRAETGGSSASRARRDGLIPGIMYRRGIPTVPTTIGYNKFMTLAQLARSSQVFNVKSTDKEINGSLVIVKEIQKDHLSGRLLHLDFQLLREDEEVSVNVPLEFTGEASGVKNQGGVLSIATHELPVTCLPRKIPVSLKVDITELVLGKTIHAENVELPEGTKLSGNPHQTIVSIVTVRQTIVEEVAVVGAPVAGAEGAAAAAPAAGAPAAAGAAAAAPAAGAKGKDSKK